MRQSLGQSARKTTLVALGLVIAAVIGGWWWLHGRGPAKPAASAATRTELPTLPAPDRPGRNGEITASPRVLIDDDPRGSLRLEGQVIDASDHGVAGATVVLASNPPRTVLTEADGSFSFDGLLARPYTVLARATQGVAGPITARLTERSDPVVLRLKPAGKLTVTVVGVDGRPLGGATVELRGIDVQRQVTRAGPSEATDGRKTMTGVAVFAPVAPGPYQIAAWADGMAHSFQRIQVGAGDAEARLKLGAGAAVAGKVVDDRGAGIGGARVRYGGASDWGQQASGALDGVMTAADGTFRFEALPAGSFRFTASHPERAAGSSSLVTLDGKTPHEGVVITLAVGAVVRGHVVDAQHRPVASARVRIAGASGDPRRAAADPPRQAYSDAQGAFEIKGLPRKALSAVALHETGSSQTVAVDATGGDVSELTLTIDVTGTISGTVVDPRGEPVEGAQVTAGPSFGGRGPGGPGGGFAELRLRGLPDALSDAAGKFTVTGLAPGEYRLTASTGRAGGRGRGFRDGVTASTGEANVRLVLEPDGSVMGKVAFDDGRAPDLFTVGVGPNQQSFTGSGGSFTLEGLAPSTYELTVRGPSFQTRSVEVVIDGARTTDAGTITVVRGRSIGGIVVADGQPVPGATVYAGTLLFGNGTTSSAQGPGGAGGPGGVAGAFGAGTKTTTTDDAGTFSLSGFGAGDLTIVAEQDAIGRSPALRVPTAMPGQTSLTLTLQKFGSLGGTLRQGGKPAEGVVVTCQSTSTPGALYTVPAGSDGAYRFDRLAPDTYKVSATLGTLRTGTRFYSKQVDVPPGGQVTVDLSVDAGTVALSVAITARTTLGLASAWLVSGQLTARTASELSLRLAAVGTGASQRVVSRGGQPAQFTEVAAGPYTVCVTPYPVEVTGPTAITYANAHGDALPVYCQPANVAATPDQQSASISVEIPPFIPDPPAPGSPGPGTGSGGSPRSRPASG
jgi:hypothetical protein